MEVLVVDGYNIINQWPELADEVKDNLENARRKFLEYLSNYQGYRQIKVIVVFDAHFMPSNEKHLKYDELEVVFTKEGQTADNYIEKLVRKLSGKDRVVVATSDFLEQTLILGGGATRLSARELISDIKEQNKILQDLNLKDKAKRNWVESNLEPYILESLDKLRNKE